LSADQLAGRKAMNLSKAALDRFLKAPDPSITAVLFYGPDQGLARERARDLTRSLLGSADDPFRLAQLTAREAGEDPARLADELNAIAMLGGRRVVSVGPAIDGRHNEPLASALKDILPGHTDGNSALLVVEAGDLPQRHALVQAFVAAPSAVAVRCYHDSGQDLRPLIVETLREAGYEAAPEALDYLVRHLGDDRGVTRSELQKLCLYVGLPRRRIALADAMASIGDQAEVAQDDLMMALAEGDLAGLERFYDRCLVDAEPVALLRAASRHFMRLHLIAGRMEAGETFEAAAAGLRPPLFWTIRNRVERQCRRWKAADAAWAITRLIEAEAEAMRHHAIAATLARMALLAIARKLAGPERARRA
jgi:DNA polymerase-3 subunit delta